jgi:hypothetical protein
MTTWHSGEPGRDEATAKVFESELKAAEQKRPSGRVWSLRPLLASTRAIEPPLGVGSRATVRPSGLTTGSVGVSGAMPFTVVWARGVT